MKKLLFLLLTVIFTISLTAMPVSQDKAKKIADEFLQIKHKESVKQTQIQTVFNSKTKVAYIFQLQPDGFIAVSADDNVYPIMAYSFNNRLILDDDNLIYYMIKTDINNRIEHNPTDVISKNKQVWDNFISSKDRDYFQQWPAPNSTSTGGWVEDRWFQSGIYNAFCPLDNSGQRSVVGCVATAMAMIVDFHKSIGNAHFTNADDYWSGYYDAFKIDDTYQERDYPSFPQLNGYLDELKSHYLSGAELTNQDKAALSFACGVSVEMGYSSQGSGAMTEDVPGALRNKFGFDTANYQNNYGSSFYNTLKNNMKAMKPAELTIHWSDGSHGHAIVCDGYNTDEYYHLNFGWGTSDNSCWYLLPNGMPAGYSVVDGAAVNIEGGDIPVQVTGQTNITGATSEGIYITLDGPRFYEAYILDTSCYFEFPAVETGTYTATAIKEGRLYYDQQIVEITPTNHYITFNMGNFEALTGTVTAPIDPAGTKIDIYKDNQVVYSGEADNNGAFSIPDVLPGNYVATASLGDNYFKMKNIEVTLDNQTVNFNLEEYNGQLNVGYHNFSTDKWSLMANYTISCAIKLTADEIQNHQNDPLARISFKAPVSSDVATISVQLWEGNNLLAENSVDNFSEGEWVTQSLDRFVLLNPEKEYYAAYEITSQTGEMAFLDNGPRVADKGAYFHTSAWSQIPATVFDKNFCIDAVFISQDFATISGTVSTSDNYQNLDLGIIKTGSNYIAHSNSDGSYSICLKEGTYDLTAFLPEHSSQTINSVSVTSGQTLQDIDFVLDYQQSSHDNVIPIENLSAKVYPNPFVAASGKSNVTFEITGKSHTANDKIQIYNLKGEKIRTLYLNSTDKASWDLKDSNQKQVASGIYFYRIKSSNYTSPIRKFSIIK